jgi:hypothetical protein
MIAFLVINDRPVGGNRRKKELCRAHSEAPGPLARRLPYFPIPGQLGPRERGRPPLDLGLIRKPKAGEPTLPGFRRVSRVFSPARARSPRTSETKDRFSSDRRSASQWKRWEDRKRSVQRHSEAPRLLAGRLPYLAIPGQLGPCERGLPRLRCASRWKLWAGR